MIVSKNEYSKIPHKFIKKILFGYRSVKVALNDDDYFFYSTEYSGLTQKQAYKAAKLKAISKSPFNEDQIEIKVSCNKLPDGNILCKVYAISKKDLQIIFQNFSENKIEVNRIFVKNDPKIYFPILKNKFFISKYACFLASITTLIICLNMSFIISYSNFKNRMYQTDQIISSQKEILKLNNQFITNRNKKIENIFKIHQIAKSANSLTNLIFLQQDKTRNYTLVSLITEKQQLLLEIITKEPINLLKNFRENKNVKDARFISPPLQIHDETDEYETRIKIELHNKEINHIK